MAEKPVFQKNQTRAARKQSLMWYYFIRQYCNAQLLWATKSHYQAAPGS